MENVQISTQLLYQKQIILIKKKNYFVTIHTCHFFNISLPSSHLNSNHTQTKKKGAPETSVSCNLLSSYAYTADSHSDCDGVHHGNKTDC